MDKDYSQEIKQALDRHRDLLYPQDGKADIHHIIEARQTMLDAPTWLRWQQEKIEQLEQEMERMDERNMELLRTRINIDNTKIWKLEDANNELQREVERLTKIVQTPAITKEDYELTWNKNEQLRKALEEFIKKYLVKDFDVVAVSTRDIEKLNQALGDKQ